ncbi:MAG: hypothetical protein QXK24_01230 [Ignisphaera sp.]
MLRKLASIITLLLTFFPSSVLAGIDVSSYAHFGFMNGCYINFASRQTFFSIYRENGMWFFNGYGFRIDDGNMTITQFFTEPKPKTTLFKASISAPSLILSQTKIYIKDLGSPSLVYVNNQEIEASGSYLEFTQKRDTTWFYDEGDKVVYIKIKHLSTMELEIVWTEDRTKTQPRIIVNLPAFPNITIPEITIPVPSPLIGVPSLNSPSGIIMVGMLVALFLFISRRQRWTIALSLTAAVASLMGLLLFRNPYMFAISLVLVLLGILIDRYV